MSPPDRPCPRCGAALPREARFCAVCGFAAARLAPGQILDGKYEILDKLAEGGMGEVYRARHLHLDEVRIIKITKPDPSGDGSQGRRFQEEARLATLVRHPNVAALYDFSRQADGSYYMVSEFIDGVTLEAWLRKRGRLLPEQAVAVARQVLAGLSEIHAQGIVHRDLSPDNIMVREAPDGGLRAKIIDLGIAKRVAAESLQMTGTGLFLGKLKYCSPEQAGALPSGEVLDARSDIYSFGAVLYEMLSGKAPFESSTPEGYIGKHLHAPAPPLDVSALPKEAGAALAAVVARTLEKKRERRYGSARELSEALAAVSLGAAAARTSPPPVTGARPRGARRIVSAAVMGLILVAAAAWLVRRAAVAPRRPLETRSRTAAAPAPAPAPTVAPGVSPGPTASAAISVETTPASPASPPPPAPAEVPARPASRLPSDALRLVAQWKALPPEARARRAIEVAREVNPVVSAHPDDPASVELRETLPVFLKSQALSALDHAEPLVALLYFRAYRTLDFAPPDPDLERRLERLGASVPPTRERGTPAPDGR